MPKASNKEVESQQARHAPHAQRPNQAGASHRQSLTSFPLKRFGRVHVHAHVHVHVRASFSLHMCHGHGTCTRVGREGSWVTPAVWGYLEVLKPLNPELESE